jgi:DNA-binding response OmpR family regulator
MAWICDHCLAVHDEDFNVISFGDLTLERNRFLTCGDISVRLTRKEAEIATDLLKGRAVSKEAMLMRHFHEDASEKGPDVFISKIRKKLETLRTTCHLETIWGLGVQLKKPQDKEGVVMFGDLSLDISRCAVFCGGKSVALRPQTMSVMQDLMSQTFVSDDTLVRYIKKGDEPAKVKNVRVHITHVRRALRELESEVNIVTVKKALDIKPGYWLRKGKIANAARSPGPKKLDLGSREYAKAA